MSVLDTWVAFQSRPHPNPERTLLQAPEASLLETVRDARNNVTTTVYNAASQLSATADPVPIAVTRGLPQKSIP
ncbi:MAG: hypothetical protein AMXMBFR19_15610 [Chthonomonadaceae bacterium]|uniref:Uncharacterized protein n=1 Tax=Candidatus Nitrosymbiomonas proteolyticus TaxID=2608984 RepID=A0A809R4K4_9BACT|nr:hypothetical protein NPRO_01150 [Candidatus Nitrosymbiomonas proteolyticus]